MFERWVLINLGNMFSVDISKAHKSGKDWTNERVVDENKANVMG